MDLKTGWSKGFYFSFDAFLALTVMAASIMVVAQSSDVSSDPFESSTISYRKADLVGQDSMRLASRQTFDTFNSSFQQELVDETVMEEGDMDRTVLDGITYLWAARNFTYAREATKKYFGSKIPSRYDYRLQVNEDGTDTKIYETSTIPGDAAAVSSISRLVSGHSIDKPSEGFQARARATETKKNQTRVVDIPMMGSGGLNQNLYLRKRFQLNASEIHSATIFFAAHWGQSNFNSNSIELNGNELDVGGSQDSDWLHLVEKNGNHIGFDRANVTSEVQEGWNEFYLEFLNQNSHHVHIHPGTRLRIRYSETEQSLNTVPKREYFTDVEGGAGNQNKRGGAWINKPVYIPEGSKVENVSLRLNVRNVRNVPARPDIEVYMNEDKIYTENLDGDAIRQVPLTSHVDNGTNVLSVYVNTFVDDGEITGFGGYPDNPRIFSNPDSSPETSSSVYIEYDEADTGLKFGKIRVTDSRNIGGSRGNPKEFEEELREGIETNRVFVNLAQLDSRNVTVEAGQGVLQNAFTSPREFSTPSRIGVESEIMEPDEKTDFNIEDECTVKCSILPQSSIEKQVLVPSQVGYGGLFVNRSAAKKDASDRLKNLMGEYADATSIDNDVLTTGNQPYLWGPASIKLVVWRE